jgi:hypothetical protein
VGGWLQFVYVLGVFISFGVVFPMRAGSEWKGLNAIVTAFAHEPSRRNGIPWVAKSFAKALAWPVVLGLWLKDDRPESPVVFGPVAARELGIDPDSLDYHSLAFATMSRRDTGERRQRPDRPGGALGSSNRSGREDSFAWLNGKPKAELCEMCGRSELHGCGTADSHVERIGIDDPAWLPKRLRLQPQAQQQYTWLCTLCDSFPDVHWPSASAASAGIIVHIGSHHHRGQLAGVPPQFSMVERG